MSMEIMTIQNVRVYLDGQNTAWLNVEDVARGLGFTQTKNGAEYVRWETVNRYLAEFGFSQQVGKDDFIPENMFYRLAMKANNATAEEFQAKVADEILPSIRKHGVYDCPQKTKRKIFCKELGERIRTAREALSLERKDVAAELGISLYALGYYERGGREISPYHLRRLSEILGRSPKWLLGY